MPVSAATYSLTSLLMINFCKNVFLKKGTRVAYPPKRSVSGAILARDRAYSLMLVILGALNLARDAATENLGSSNGLIVDGALKNDRQGYLCCFFSAYIILIIIYTHLYAMSFHGICTLCVC